MLYLTILFSDFNFNIFVIRKLKIKWKYNGGTINEGF